MARNCNAVTAKRAARLLLSSEQHFEGFFTSEPMTLPEIDHVSFLQRMRRHFLPVKLRRYVVTCVITSRDTRWKKCDVLLCEQAVCHRRLLALDGGSIISVARCCLFSLSVVEATACRVVNSLIFLNKIQEIKDIRQSKFAASIF